MAETNDVFNHLSLEQIGKVVQERQLAQQASYTQQEIDLFPQEVLPGDGGKTRPPEEPHDTAHEQSKPIDSLGLLTLVSLQLGSNISIIEAGNILVACGLTDLQEYNERECEVFLEACSLIKQQGKTYQEVVVHFGVTPTEEQSRDALIREVRSSLDRVSSIQVEQIRTSLPLMAAQQLQEIKLQFWRMTARRLQQCVTSGQLEAEIRTASESILATTGKYLGLLRSSSSPKNLKSLLG